MKPTNDLNYYFILSAVGAVLILVMILFEASNAKTIQIYDKLFVGTAFIVSCIFGISLAFKPNWIRKLTKIETHSDTNTQTRSKSKRRLGHHPICDQFKSHTIKINGKVRCGGCTGLAIGAIVSIILMSIFLMIPYKMPLYILQFVLILGLILIAFNFLETKTSIGNSRLHLISNVFLIIGFLLVVISIFQITNNKIYALSGLLITFLWLDTRIMLSKWHHEYICGNCKEKCSNIW